MDPETLQEAATRLLAAGGLGRSDVLRRLFEFLLERSATGASPKETEVATAVFRTGSDFDPSLDASVRVSAHRLRRKLETYYAGRGRDDPVRLELRKGEYRLVASLAEIPRETEKPLFPLRGGGRGWILLAALALFANLLIWVFTLQHPPSADGLGAVRRSAPWAALMRDKSRPLFVVVGDYYIFGDTDMKKGVDRLLREYTVNSSSDLDAFRAQHPQVAGEYQDLDLYYLPVAIAQAMRNIVPILTPTVEDIKRLRVILASDLTPDMLRRGDILYIGYFSGLGLLRDPVFAGSRFSVGPTYDELVDSVSGRTYASQSGGPDQNQGEESDYGYVSSFNGPTGNRIVIVAGSRDIGLMQTSEELMSSNALALMAKTADHTDAFEALYSVEGIRRSNLNGRLISTSPLTKGQIWGDRPVMHFPPG